jgi:hypothetical protein
MISLNKYMQKDNFSLSHPKSFLILLISLLMIAGLHGQGQRGKLTGTVKDAGTGEPNPPQSPSDEWYVRGTTIEEQRSKR